MTTKTSSSIKDEVKPADNSAEYNQDTDQIKVEYFKPFFHRRFFADLIDFLLLFVFWVLMFVASKGIVSTFPDYQKANTYVSSAQLNSGLYMESTDQIVTVVTYYSNNSSTLTAKEIKDGYSSSIEKFISYMYANISTKAGDEARKDYDDFRLDESMVYSQKPYFIVQAGQIIENPECEANYQLYSSNVYEKYIQDRAYGLLSTLDLKYLDNTRYISNMLFFFEMPFSVVLSSIIVFYIPPLIFRRGRKTIGKLMYHIGRVDSNYLNVSFGRFTAEAAIFIFGIIVLSFVTLGIPLIISFSMMAFSKNKQDFADYMLNIQEVEDDRSKIYFSKEEILLEATKKNKEPVNFKMEDIE